MMKIVNRLLIVLIVLGGVWFLVNNQKNQEQTNAPETETQKTTEENVKTEKEVKNQKPVRRANLKFESKNKRITNVVEKKDEEKTETFVAVPKSPSPRDFIPSRQNLLKTTTYVRPEVTPVEPVVALPKSYVTVYLYEYQVDMTSKEIPAGNVTFRVYNSGTFTHNFSIDGVKSFGKVIPGETKFFTIDLGAGDYHVSSPRRVDSEYEMGEDFSVVD